MPTETRSGPAPEEQAPSQDEQQARALFKKLEGVPEAAGITFDDAFRYVLDGEEGVDATKSPLLARAERSLKREASKREKPPRIMSYLDIPAIGMKNKLCFVLGIDSSTDSMDSATLGNEKFREKLENSSFLREIAAAKDTNIGEIIRKRLEAFGFRSEDLTVIASIKEGRPRTIKLYIAHHDDKKAIINGSFFLHINI